MRKVFVAAFATAALFALPAGSASAAPPGAGCPDSGFSHVNSSPGYPTALSAPGAARHGGVANKQANHACG